MSVALVGPPNVGKSSLLNRLVGTERAIVTPQAGTTRDIIEGQILVQGVPIRFFDTAGLRESSDLVEAEGVRRSQKLLEEADFLFWVIDASKPEESLKEMESQKPDSARTWFLFNKSDLTKSPTPWKAFSSLPADRCLLISCQTPEGVKPLVKRLQELVEAPASSGDVLLTSQRHQKEAWAAFEALERLRGLYEGQSHELWAEELREAALAVGRIRGRNLPATAFEDIFTKFCIGK